MKPLCQMREGGLWVLQPSALPHLTPYIDALRSYSSLVHSKRKSWVRRVGFFVKRAWQVCCERNTNTSSHAGRGSDSSRLAESNISCVARELHTLLAAGASRVLLLLLWRGGARRTRARPQSSDWTLSALHTQVTGRCRHSTVK